MKLTHQMRSAIQTAMTAAKVHIENAKYDLAWAELSRAHIISQPALGPHLAVHRAMLRLAVRERQAKEVFGQLLRLSLAPLGHWLGRTPWGNSGKSDVSKFARAPLPEDIARLYEEAGVKTR